MVASIAQSRAFLQAADIAPVCCGDTGVSAARRRCLAAPVKSPLLTLAYV